MLFVLLFSNGTHIFKGKGFAASAFLVLFVAETEAGIAPDVLAGVIDASVLWDLLANETFFIRFNWFLFEFDIR